MPVINPKTGKEFRWANGPKPTTRARWSKKTMFGGEVKGSIRAIAHLDQMDHRAHNRFNSQVVVIQSAFNSTIAASEGTHDYDLVYDLYIPGVSWWTQQRFFRRNGFWCWYRPTTPGLWSNHVHGICMVPYKGDPSKAIANHGYKVGKYIDGGFSTAGRIYTSSQVHDYVNHAYGLKDRHTPGSDHSWFPADLHDHIFKLNDYIAHRRAIQEG